MIIGVDLGNYGVKTSERVSFLSKVSDVENFTNESEVIYEDKKLYIGNGEFSTDWNKSMKETTLPLLFTALAKSSKESIFKVIVGLPIQQYKQNKISLKELIKNNRLENLIMSNDSLFDNVMGFKKVGEQLWLER